MRRELKKRGIPHLPVVFSDEPPRRPDEYSGGDAPREGKHALPGSLSFVPGAAGLVLAGYILRRLAGIEDGKDG